MKGTGKSTLWALLIITSAFVSAQDVSVIGNQAFQGASGRAAVNMAAGNFNQQANNHAIGQEASVRQSNLLMADDWQAGDGEAISSIESMAFAGFTGMLSVNQVSGNQNLQINAGAISSLPTALEDRDLTLVSAMTPGMIADAPAGQTLIAADSLSQAQGVIQLNQISGNSNVAVNQFSLQLSGGN
ncbi:hypothetical protein [Shewanella sp. GXUN23E]|uniref:hypothetical protein n=1 Tax=Shewanella sp. GXUN23E TaxID=3422498 RepID=UPI003D7E4DF1